MLIKSIYTKLFTGSTAIKRKHFLGQNRFIRLVGIDFRRRIRGWSCSDCWGIRLSGTLMINFRLIEIPKAFVFSGKFLEAYKCRCSQ
jgi:hypothetical protein